MDANNGLANVYSDLSVPGLIKGDFSKGHSDKKASSFGTWDAKGKNIRGSYVRKNRRRAVSPRPLEQHIGMSCIPNQSSASCSHCGTLPSGR